MINLDQVSIATEELTVQLIKLCCSPVGFFIVMGIAIFVTPLAIEGFIGRKK